MVLQNLLRPKRIDCQTVQMTEDLVRLAHLPQGVGDGNLLAIGLWFLFCYSRGKRRGSRSRFEGHALSGQRITLNGK